MKLNLKAYWREILIGILVLLLIWVSSSVPKVIRTGSSETICRTDTIIVSNPVGNVVKYVKVLVPVTDTIIDTLDIDHYITKIDTSWLYADIPTNVYDDSLYYVKAIGWVDSIVIYENKLSRNDLTKDVKTNNVQIPEIYFNTQVGTQLMAPGINLLYKRVQVGYNFNLIDGSGCVTIGYKML